MELIHEEMINFTSIFYEAGDQKIKDYQDQLKKLEALKKDGTPEKICRGLSIYFSICKWTNIICGVIIPLGFIAALIDHMIVNWLDSQSKKGQLKQLKKKVDSDIKSTEKLLARMENGKDKKTTEKNLQTLRSISDKLASAINNA